MLSGRLGRVTIAGLALLSGCAGQGAPENSSTPVAQSSLSSGQASTGAVATTTGASTPSPVPSTPRTPAPTPSQPTASQANPTSATPSPSRAETQVGKPRTLALAMGETAQLAHFDATALRTTRGKDGVSHGWKVRVCYTRAHAEQNADGTTRVSSNPWSVKVRDGEGGGGAVWVPVDEFPADQGWVPPYPERRIRVGECAEGWLAIKHGNPDLQFMGLRYAPADFEDAVTWGGR